MSSQVYSICHACIHMYICSCADPHLHSTVCKYSHFIQLSRLQTDEHSALHLSKKNNDDKHMTLEEYGEERDVDKQAFEEDQRTDVNVNNESDENGGDEHMVFAKEVAEVITETTSRQNNVHSAASDLYSVDNFAEVLKVKSSSDTSIIKQKEDAFYELQTLVDVCFNPDALTTACCYGCYITEGN